MYTYIVEFTYVQDSQRIRDKDTAWGDCAQDAVDQIRDEYLWSVEDLRIVSVSVLDCGGWDVVGNWGIRRK